MEPDGAAGQGEDLHHVEAERRIGQMMLRAVHFGTPPEMALLGGRHRFCRHAPAERGAGLDLHEDERRSVLHDEVDLAVEPFEIFSDEGESLLLQIGAGEGFPLPSESGAFHGRSFLRWFRKKRIAVFGI